MDAEAEAPSDCSSVGLRLRVSTGREPCVVLLRLVIQTRSYLLSCHEATSGGADTRHAETTQHWVERPLRETLQLLFGLEDAAAASLIESGAVYLEQRRATACAAPVPAGSQLRVHLQPKQHALPEKLTIVECAEEFVVCSKPSGVPVHPTVDSLQQNLLWAAAAQLRMRLLPTSRLDEGTSGLVRLARPVVEAATLCTRGGHPTCCHRQQLRPSLPYRRCCSPARSGCRRASTSSCGGARSPRSTSHSCCSTRPRSRSSHRPCSSRRHRCRHCLLQGTRVPPRAPRLLHLPRLLCLLHLPRLLRRCARAPCSCTGWRGGRAHPCGSARPP